MAQIKKTKRLLDIIGAGILILVLAIPMTCIALLIVLTSGSPVLYWSDRVGVNNKIFRMPKFRTMRRDSPILATHLLKEPEQYITVVGKFLRRMSLDELPQLWNIINGDMSFVGPRPALYNQKDLIAVRTQKGIHGLTPGLTGWAQIHGRDELSLPLKVQYDEYYLIHQSWRLDLNILWHTFFKVTKGEGISH